jgi:hypothetical protein
MWSHRAARPHEPVLIRIDDVDLRAPGRTSAWLRVCAGIVQSDYWITAVCPIEEPAVVVAVTG